MACIFCRIVVGEVPSTKVFEDNEILAIKDINPISTGHIVIFSKKHFEETARLPSDDLGDLFKKTVELAEKIKAEEKADGYNILLSEGEAAQSAVPHRPHLHIIPRKFGDNLKIDPRGTL